MFLCLLVATPVVFAEDAAPPPPADAPPAEAPPLSAEELAALEAALAADATVVATPPPPPAPTGAISLQSLNPDLSFIADVAFGYFTADAPRMSGGHDPQANGFTLQQLELSVGKSVDPYFRFDSNLVFSLYGVEIEEVYATTLALPGGLQVRAGQFLTRFGRINNTHPHAWDFVDQAFAIGRVFGGEGNRGLGVEASWLTPLPWYVEVVGSGTGAAGESTARSFYGADDLGFETPADLQGTLAVKQFFPVSDDVSVFWGLSAASGPNPTGLGNRSEVYGTDLYVKLRPISRGDAYSVALQTEWLYRRRQVPGDVWADVTGYAQVAARVSPRWGVAARYQLGTPAVGLDGAVADDTLDPEWTADRHRGSLSATYWPTEFSRIRIQGHTDLAGWEDQPEYAGLLAFEFNVGAHGAHAF